MEETDTAVTGLANGQEERELRRTFNPGSLAESA